MNCMVICMRISLDTNIWIFGLLENNEYCKLILDNLSQFQIVVPNQIRIELERNLPDSDLKKFYQVANKAQAEMNYEDVPQIYITMFQAKGLKKGDAIIGGFSEWKRISAIVSDNRDFLRGLSPDHYFEVMSPKEFCAKFDL